MMRLVTCSCIALLCAVACAEAPASDPVARGGQVYRALDCGRCHQIAGEGATFAPPLTHIGTIAATREPGTSAEAYIRESIVSPSAYVVPGYPDVMPRGFSLGLSPSDLDALVTYLTSLR